jgi:hypothetical protein
MQKVAVINSLEEAMKALPDEALAAKTGEFRGRLRKGETLDDLLPEAFAVVREASRRVLNMRHYDVQLVRLTGLHLLLHQRLQKAVYSNFQLFYELPAVKVIGKKSIGLNCLGPSESCCHCYLSCTGRKTQLCMFLTEPGIWSVVHQGGHHQLRLLMSHAHNTISTRSRSRIFTRIECVPCRLEGWCCMLERWRRCRLGRGRLWWPLWRLI